MKKPVKQPISAKRLPLPAGNGDWAAVKGGYWSAAPVISITFKDAKGTDWTATRSFIE